MAPSLVKKAKATGKEMASQLFGAFRGRASTIGARLHIPVLSNDGEGFSVVRGLSRSFTATAQPFSARRTSVSSTGVQAENIQQQHDTPLSPVDVQQFRFPPSVPHRVWEAERFVARNRNPDREDEYLSYTSSSSSADASLADAYDIEARGGSEQLREAYSVGNDDWIRAIANGTEQSEGSQFEELGTLSEEIPTPHFEIDVEADLESDVLRRTEPRDFWSEGNLAARLHQTPTAAPPNPTPRPQGYRDLERRQGIVFDETTAHSVHEQDAPPPTLPPLHNLTPQPRRRSRPIIRDAQRRQGRFYHNEKDYVFLTGLDNAIHISTTTNETIHPHLTGQELETCRRQPPPQPAPADVSSAAYTQTDTTRYRDLTGEREQRRFPPPPPAEPITSIHATIHDVEIREGEVRYTDATYRPCPTPPLIRSTDFRPVAGLRNNPHHPGTTTTDTISENISNALGRVGGYLVGGAEVVAARVTEMTAQGGRRRRHPPYPNTNTNTNTAFSPHHHQPRHQQPRDIRTNTNEKPLPPLPSSSSSSHHQTRSIHSQNTNTSKAIAGLILTTQEFPPVLTREGPGSRMVLPVPPYPRHQQPESVEVPAIVVTSPSSSCQGSCMDDDGDEDEGEKEAWKRLTLHTAEWEGFGGEWARGWSLEG
ncbi:MAG: hypothetical protein LQ338_001264 [Usnochroma carphineum]|nr:MAG: hypothetical protein LQ338_001264 [Usnochroma carphineum]